MSVIGSISLLVSANTEKLSKGLSSAKGAISDFAAKVGPGAAIAGAAIAAGLAAGAAAIASLTQTAMANADDMAKNASLIGLSVKAYSELSHAATRSDLDIGTLTGGLKKLNVNLAEAASTGKGG